MTTTRSHFVIMEGGQKGRVALRRGRRKKKRKRGHGKRTYQYVHKGIEKNITKGSKFKNNFPKIYGT